MTGGYRRWDGGHVNVANVIGEECCQSTEYGRGCRCEAPKVTNVGELKCGNEDITTPEAPLDDDGYSDIINLILLILCVKSIIIS